MNELVKIPADRVTPEFLATKNLIVHFITTEGVEIPEDLLLRLMMLSKIHLGSDHPAAYCVEGGVRLYIIKDLNTLDGTKEKVGFTQRLAEVFSRVGIENSGDWDKGIPPTLVVDITDFDASCLPEYTIVN